MHDRKRRDAEKNRCGRRFIIAGPQGTKDRHTHTYRDTYSTNPPSPPTRRPPADETIVSTDIYSFFVLFFLSLLREHVFFFRPRTHLSNRADARMGTRSCCLHLRVIMSSRWLSTYMSAIVVKERRTFPPDALAHDSVCTFLQACTRAWFLAAFIARDVFRMT